MKASLLVALMLVATSATASQGKQRHHRVARPCTTATVTQNYEAWDAVVNGFSITSGFRWDRECPELQAYVPVHHPSSHHEDPFFVGGELRLPLNQWADIAGNVDRDFTDAPHWNARVFLSAHPWRK